MKHPNRKIRNITIASVIVSPAVLFQLARFVILGHRANIIYRQRTWIAGTLLLLLSKLFPKRLVLSKLGCVPYYLPATELCNENQRNYRAEGNDAIISISQELAKSIQLPYEENSYLSKWNRTDAIPSYLEFQLALLVRAHVFMYYHLSSLRLRSDSLNSEEYVLLIPRVWWGKVLINELISG